MRLDPNRIMSGFELADFEAGTLATRQVAELLDRVAAEVFDQGACSPIERDTPLAA